jgi:hypothetical protein
MSLLFWCANRCGGLSIILLLTLCFWVIFNEFLIRKSHHLEHSKGHKHALPPAQILASSRPGFWTPIFVFYSLLIHALVIVFPLRACWAIWEFTGNLQHTTLKTWNTTISTKPWHKWKVPSSTSLASTNTSVSQLSPSQSSSEKGDYWGSATESEDELEPVIHAIFIPNYKESVDGLRETLDVLACHPQAKYSYHASLSIPTLITSHHIREANGS